jgi:hypothetical protein
MGAVCEYLDIDEFDPDSSNGEIDEDQDEAESVEYAVAEDEYMVALGLLAPINTRRYTLLATRLLI